MKRSPFALAALALSLVCANAAADPSVAEALFEEGVSLSEHGALPQACAKFEASEALDVAVGTLLRLADCYERTQRLASAWSRFREAASLAQTQGMPERQRIATVRAEALHRRMARLTIKVPPNPPAGYELELSGVAVPVASWGSALPVDAGTLTVQASAPGYVGFERAVRIPSLDAARVELSVPRLEPEPAATTSTTVMIARKDTAKSAPAHAAAAVDVPEPPRGAAEDRGYGARALGATFAVVGGAGVAAAGVLTVVAARRSDHALDYCTASSHSCPPRGVELRNEAHTLAEAAAISAAAGGALLVTGFVVYTAAPSAHSSERVSISAVPEAKTRGVTLQMRGVF